MYDTKWSDGYLKSTGYKPNGSTEHDHLCRCPGCEGNDPPEDQQVMREAEQVGQDCPHCPKGDNGHHQYKIEEGCYVDGKPSCEWCARTEEVWGQWQDENAIESVPVPGWPPSAQETVYYQQIMAKPDEF